MSSEQQPLLASDRPDRTYASSTRHQVKRFLTSKTGHYAVLILVSLDISSIFADLILQLLACEGRIATKPAEQAEEALGILGLNFSCLFLAELLASIWAFGYRYFYSWFHCLDAAVITASFVIDVVLRGVLEEVGSLVIVLRLFRVFKIIEELSAGAEEQMEPLHERIEELEESKRELEREVDELKRRQRGEARV